MHNISSGQSTTEEDVKRSATGILSFLLLSTFWVSTGSAQQQAPPTPPTPPPDQQQEERPQPTGRPNVRQPPPPLPKVPDIRQPGETGYFIGINAWFPTQHPMFNKGRAATFTDESRLDFQGKPKLAQGGEIGFAAGAHNTVHLMYFQGAATGNFTNTGDLRVWNQLYEAGNNVATYYKLQSAKISFEYLTWPFPVEKRRFRLRTLWGVQYTSVKTHFDLPALPLVDSTGAPILDAGGNAVNYATQGTHWYILPSIGLSATQYLSRHVRVEASGSGFTIPRHTTTWDAEGSVNFRQGHVELRLGGRAFHFKSSTQLEYYMRGTQFAPFVGLRWYSD
jgi:hypothetical protein